MEGAEGGTGSEGSALVAVDVGDQVPEHVPEDVDSPTSKKELRAWYNFDVANSAVANGALDCGVTHVRVHALHVVGIHVFAVSDLSVSFSWAGVPAFVAARERVARCGFP
jgi:hypothetical protein